MRRTKLEMEQTRQRLLDAAECVFSDQGYAAAKLEDIAEVAGLSRGSIYWHFKGKLELLYAVVDRAWFPWDRLPVDKMEAERVPSIREMAGVLEHGMQCILADTHLRRSALILLQGHGLRHATARAQVRLQGMQLRLRRYVALVIEQANEGRLTRNELDAQARDVGIYVFGALSEALLTGRAGEHHSIGRQVERFILAFLLPAVAAG
ncbi:TetR/AcrR family transcriptional regulator [Pseudomonas aeruginosa]|nr:TetR/AcrR family transcriptional regulator [Pseudomonas aeruginosa]MCS9139083.1 TetR/AcrR family transcriptional regulator [Pseudomonas aeruginosa]MCS9211936.1 TetR/AcrR family transcriptional regulator [Pseudomonas aeruginosa]